METFACFSALYTGVAALVFAPAETYYHVSKRSWLPPTWAWTQLVVAGVIPMLAGVTAIAIAPFAHQHGLGISVGFGAGALVVGGWFLAPSTSASIRT